MWAMSVEREPSVTAVIPRKPAPAVRKPESVVSFSIAPPKPFSFGNRPALTGVPALWMVAVVACHANLTILTDGRTVLARFFGLRGDFDQLSVSL
jgi:hypothetical protein